MRRRAAIFGTGLIGTSLGMALRQVGWEVAGWDPSQDALEAATNRGAVDLACDYQQEAVEGAEVVVLAGPLSATIRTIGRLRTDALVTDVAGVKTPVTRARPPGLRLVAGHPMAGREQAGPGAATASLFRGAAWIICPDGAEPADVDAVSDLVKSIGANPFLLSAEEHDRIVSDISHLPQLLAVALVELLSRRAGIAEQLVAGSFRDLTRVAASESNWWTEVLTANDANVSDSIGRMIGLLMEIDSEIGSVAGPLASRMDRARSKRKELEPPVARVGVVLYDRPGELARVGRALELSAVDVRDLQLRHHPHGGGGVLVLSVRPEEAPSLRGALLRADFVLE